LSLLSTNPRFLRTVVLEEDLQAMKDTAGGAGELNYLILVSSLVE